MTIEDVSVTEKIVNELGNTIWFEAQVDRTTFAALATSGTVRRKEDELLEVVALNFRRASGTGSGMTFTRKEAEVIISVLTEALKKD